ncbi:MAG: hypothetical protein KF746_11955 [Chitinophagaceae bacterium]|nr:hypothetical protein [Chitinophagaceae bacterium]
MLADLQPRANASKRSRVTARLFILLPIQPTLVIHLSPSGQQVDRKIHRLLQRPIRDAWYSGKGFRTTAQIVL